MPVVVVVIGIVLVLLDAHFKFTGRPPNDARNRSIWGSRVIRMPQNMETHLLMADGFVRNEIARAKITNSKMA